MRNTLSASSVIVLNEYHASFVKNIEPFCKYQNATLGAYYVYSKAW